MEFVVTNVCNGVIDAMAAQIDGSAKNKTRSLSLRCDNRKKIEQLFGKIDCVGLLFSLTVNIGNYIEYISNASSNIIVPSSHSLQPAIDALAYVACVNPKIPSEKLPTHLSVVCSHSPVPS